MNNLDLNVGTWLWLGGIANLVLTAAILGFFIAIIPIMYHIIENNRISIGGIIAGILTLLVIIVIPGSKTVTAWGAIDRLAHGDCSGALRLDAHIASTCKQTQILLHQTTICTSEKKNN